MPQAEKYMYLFSFFVVIEKLLDSHAFQPITRLAAFTIAISGGQLPLLINCLCGMNRKAHGAQETGHK